MPGTSLVTQMVKKPPVIQETWVQVPGWEDPLEKVMAIRASVLAWRTTWAEEPRELQSMGSQRVGRHWATITFFQEMTGDCRPLHGGRRGICTLSCDVMNLGKNQLWSWSNRSYVYFEVLIFQMSVKKCEKIQITEKNKSYQSPACSLSTLLLAVCQLTLVCRNKSQASTLGSCILKRLKCLWRI